MQCLRCTILVSAAATAVAQLQPTEAFRPPGYRDLVPLEHGRGPDPADAVLHLAQLATKTSPICSGVNDVLTVTFPAPIAGTITLEDFTVLACPLPLNADEELKRTEAPPGSTFTAVQLTPECQSTHPTCVSFQLGDESNEHRTVLLYGSFANFTGQRLSSGLGAVRVTSVSVLIDGIQARPYGTRIVAQNASTGVGWSSFPDYNGDLVHLGRGPFLVDVTMHNLSEAMNTASADYNGCAELHPSATYAIRLLFASTVYEYGPRGRLVPFGTRGSTAANMFSLHTGDDETGHKASPDRVVGVADVDGDSVVDLCIMAAAFDAQVDSIVINCTADTDNPADHELLSADESACDSPIRAFLRSEADQIQNLTRAEFSAGQTIELCVSANPNNCPGDKFPPVVGTDPFAPGEPADETLSDADTNSGPDGWGGASSCILLLVGALLGLLV